MSNIKGAKYWDVKDRWHVQDNNPIEAALFKLRAENEAQGIFPKIGYESCGPTACSTSLDVRGELKPTTTGKYIHQDEQVIFDYLNDSRNYGTLQIARKDMNASSVMGNRVPQYYIPAVYELYGVETVRMLWDLTFINACDLISQGKTIQACRIKPGHYISLVAYDADTNEIIFHNPWKADPENKNGGFAERMMMTYWVERMYKWGILYG